MICPQCRCVYEDDFVFCLTDGNALIQDGVEQETILNQNVRLSTPGPVVCSTCGQSNNSNSKFCKSCGAVVQQDVSSQSFAPGYSVDRPSAQTGRPIVVQIGTQPDQPFGETVAFVPPMFTPPVQPVAAVPSNGKNILIFALAAFSVVMFAGILFMMIGGVSKTDDDQKTKLNNANSENSNSSVRTDAFAGANKNSAKKPNSPIPDDAEFENPPKDVPSLPDSFQHEYQGYSNRRLTLSLKKNGNSLSGTAATPGDLDYLDGTIQPDGSFDLAGNNRGFGVTGHWRGRIAPNGSIRGVWTATNGRRVSYSASQVR